MKYCRHCGNRMLDEAVICVKCGCAVEESNSKTWKRLLIELSEKVKINAIIWIVIGSIQILAGLYVKWFILVVGIINLISGICDLNLSKKIINEPVDIVKRFEPLAGPIIVLVYNALVGGVIGVAGSIYYLVAVRNLVVSNKNDFLAIEKVRRSKSSA